VLPPPPEQYQETIGKRNIEIRHRIGSMEIAMHKVDLESYDSDELIQSINKNIEIQPKFAYGDNKPQLLAF